MFTVILYTLLSTALWYLGSRAVITQSIWSRYPRGLAQFMDCPACTGWWWGFVLAATIGYMEHLDYLGLPSDSFVTHVSAGLGSVVLTPIMAGLMQWGFERTGSAISEDRA